MSGPLLNSTWIQLSFAQKAAGCKKRWADALAQNVDLQNILHSHERDY